MSLRETGLIRAPKPPPPPNELCQYTSYGFASGHTVLPDVISPVPN